MVSVIHTEIDFSMLLSVYRPTDSAASIISQFHFVGFAEGTDLCID